MKVESDIGAASAEGVSICKESTRATASALTRRSYRCHHPPAYGVGWHSRSQIVRVVSKKVRMEHEAGCSDIICRSDSVTDHLASTPSHADPELLSQVTIAVRP
jgi:hypothetical protein